MQAGAPEQWLKEKYQSIRKGSTHGHQAFRILCHAGPGRLWPWAGVRAALLLGHLDVEKEGSATGTSANRQ